MYYLCKEKIHGTIEKTCTILKTEKRYCSGVCNCMLVACSEEIIYKISECMGKDYIELFSEAENDIKNHFKCDESECGFTIIDEINAENFLNVKFNFDLEESMKKSRFCSKFGKQPCNTCDACNGLVKYFRDIQNKLDIIICYAALTNNAGLDGHNNEIVKNSVKDVIPILFGKQMKSEINYLFDDIRSQYSKSNIELHEFDSKLKYALLEILKCCNILKEINLGNASRYTFNKSIFKCIHPPTLTSPDVKDKPPMFNIPNDAENNTAISKAYR